MSDRYISAMESYDRSLSALRDIWIELPAGSQKDKLMDSINGILDERFIVMGQRDKQLSETKEQS